MIENDNSKKKDRMKIVATREEEEETMERMAAVAAVAAAAATKGQQMRTMQQPILATLPPENDNDENAEHAPHAVTATLEQDNAETIMNQAMALLPDDLTFEYRQACRFVPELVDKESDPRWFLRYVEKMGEREREREESRLKDLLTKSFFLTRSY
jgi:hypothetical protein